MPEPFARKIEAALKAWPAGFSVGVFAPRGTPQLPDHQWWWATDAGLGELDVTRDGGWRPMPTGRFAGKVDPQAVRTLAEALVAVDFEHALGKTPPGGPGVSIEVAAMGEVARVPLDGIPRESKLYGQVSGAMKAITESLMKQPAAAASLKLSRSKSKFTVELERLGKEPLLIGNPARAGKSEPFYFLLQLGKPWDIDPNVTTWDGFPVPAAGPPFEGGGRSLFFDGPKWTFELDDPSGGAADLAIAIRAIFADYDRPPGMRLGGVDVFARVITSNQLEPTK